MLDTQASEHRAGMGAFLALVSANGAFCVRTATVTCPILRVGFEQETEDVKLMMIVVHKKQWSIGGAVDAALDLRDV